MAEQLAFNRDCMEAMKEFPDKFFDLAVVDPPYGGGAVRERMRSAAAVQIGNNVNGHGLVDGSTNTISRTGGTWSRKYQREQLRRRVLTFAIGI